MSIEAFHRLPPGNQNRILSAALEEFASYGYDAASTNRIIEKADISKGVLFKYFSDKQGLFDYIVERYHGILQNHLKHQEEPEDMFEYIAQSIRFENDLCRGDADMRRFYYLLNRIASHVEHPVYATAYARWIELQRLNLDACYALLDVKRLRSGLKPTDARAALSIFFSGIKVWLRSEPERIFSEPIRFDEEIVKQIDILEAGLYSYAH